MGNAASKFPKSLPLRKGKKHPSSFITITSEVKCNAIGFLTAHEVDALQLVCRGFNSFVSRHGKKLPRHRVHVVWVSSSTMLVTPESPPAPPSTNPRRCLARRRPKKTPCKVLLADPERAPIGTMLESSRVCCVSRLEIWGLRRRMAMFLGLWDPTMGRGTSSSSAITTDMWLPVG